MAHYIKSITGCKLACISTMTNIFTITDWEVFRDFLLAVYFSVLRKSFSLFILKSHLTLIFELALYYIHYDFC